MRTFGYEVALGLFHPLIMDEVAPIVWGNFYTSVEFIKSIRIATSWNGQMLGWDTMIRFTFICNETTNGMMLTRALVGMVILC